jgi:hypothetical protein
MLGSFLSPSYELRGRKWSRQCYSMFVSSHWEYLISACGSKKETLKAKMQRECSAKGDHRRCMSHHYETSAARRQETSPQEEECAICLEPFAHGSTAIHLAGEEYQLIHGWGDFDTVITPCLHKFHTRCFSMQLQNSKDGRVKCSLCRSRYTCEMLKPRFCLQTV